MEEEKRVFKNYKEEQNYYKELYKNRGRIIHISKIIGRNGEVLQQGSTYNSDKGDIRRIKRRAKRERK